MSIPNDNLLELIHGFNAGIGQYIIAHPLDTYKTWLQVQHKEQITIRSLYRGFMYPTLFNSVISGLAFGTYSQLKKQDPKYGHIIGGIGAGIVTGILSSFIEYKKISAQLNIKTKFNIEGFYTILMREIPACTFYYPVYDYLRSKDFGPVMAGGLAGISCWTSSYWADVLNTHVMSGSTLKTVIAKLQYRDYWRGIGVCIPRAFVINGMGYYFYETSKKYINQ